MTSVDISKKASKELWNDYLFLTKEMSQFLEQQDMDLFYELMEQRETLQKIIEEVRDEVFSLSVVGQQLIQNIQCANRSITLKMQHIVNANRNQHNVSRAYDGLGTDAVVGNRMDRQT